MVPVQNVDKVDLLFIVDNSSSMKEEQELLRRELPMLIRTLTSGVRGNGTTFPAVRDLHLGVVSTDLGTPGVSDFFENCDARGDEGALLTRPAPDSACTAQSNGPPFLSFRVGVDDADRVAADFQCIAGLGTEGCGFEQQLEATLRAVTPGSDPDRRFWGPAGMLEAGQADLINAGFLRPAEPDPSLIAIVLVTDEEDCSSRNPAHFDATSLDAPNLRCFDNPQNLYAVQRYVDGLRALRPGQEHLVLFSAIAGIPPDLVTPEALAQLDPRRPETFTAHFDRILAHPRMQQVPVSSTGANATNLATSCETENGTAYPPRRIVEVARGFGVNGVAHSICEASFEGAIDAVIDAIVRQLPDVCLPFELVPNSSGEIEHCAVVWELPTQALPGSVTRCDELPFLHPPKSGAARAADGRARCEVDQVPVFAGRLQDGIRGWYYDDFSDEARGCATGQQRVSFTEPPPSGVRVTLECAREQDVPVQVVEDAIDTIAQPTPGSECRDATGVADDTRCRILRINGALDDRMFCHPRRNVCMLPCDSDADCPDAWRCDDRPQTTRETAGVGVCVNPTCDN